MFCSCASSSSRCNIETLQSESYSCAGLSIAGDAHTAQYSAKTLALKSALAVLARITTRCFRQQK